MNTKSSTATASRHRPRLPMAFRMVLAVLAVIGYAEVAPLASESKRWKDDDLMASYRELASSGKLEAAVRAPVLPSEAAQPAFLEALAWLAAGTPDLAGTLTLEQLDRFIDSQSQLYIHLLQAKLERGAENDFARTRTWKVVQKMTILREEMARASREGRYAYPAISRVPSGDDPWEQEHTLDSVEEFQDKVCRGSKNRPVLVKFGNTNCTQCMLFEMTGSVKEFANHSAHRDKVDVYKVWWGLSPDDSFAGKVRNPARLDDLVREEGVRSSPTFMVYRDGRRYPCEGGFPDHHGSDEGLESCLRQEFGNGPVAGVCASLDHVSGSR